MVRDDFYHNSLQIDMLIFLEPEEDINSCNDFLTVHEAVVVIPDTDFLMSKEPQLFLFLHDDADTDLAISRKWRMYCFSERQIQVLRKRAEKVKPKQ